MFKNSIDQGYYFLLIIVKVKTRTTAFRELEIGHKFGGGQPISSLFSLDVVLSC